MSPQPPKPGMKGPSAALDARAREELERQDRHRTEELLGECEKLEEDLEKLKGRFELFFLGIDRREPARERDEMKRRVARLKAEFTRNTGLRFRIETLHARFLSYERMWSRSAREKEEGTYRRDLMKARRRAHPETRRDEGSAKEAAETAAPPGPTPATEVSARGTAAAPLPVRPPALAPPAPAAGQQPAAPATSAGPGSPAPAPTPPERVRRAPVLLPPGMTEEQVRALHSAYVDAKRRCNEDASRVSYEALASTIAKQVPELMAKYKARTVEFKVVIKDGRAILKAVPRL